VNGKNVAAVGREIYMERGGAEGRAADYWLQAVAALKRLLPRKLPVRGNNRSNHLVRKRQRGAQSRRKSLKVETECPKKVYMARR